MYQGECRVAPVEVAARGFAGLVFAIDQIGKVVSNLKCDSEIKAEIRKPAAGVFIGAGQNCAYQAAGAEKMSGLIGNYPQVFPLGKIPVAPLCGLRNLAHTQAAGGGGDYFANLRFDGITQNKNSA